MFDKTKARFDTLINDRVTSPIRTSLVISVTALIVAVLALAVAVNSADR